MKKIISFTLFILLSMAGWCQYPLTTLSQNFDGVCASSYSVPASWSEYTPAHLGTYPLGSWSCSAIHGRGGTGGMQCTDTFSGAAHLDTSFLLTPLLNLSSYSPGHVYLQFDTKTTNLLLAGDLHILHVIDSARPDTGTINLTPGMTPVFTNRDSTGWVTHVIDLTAFETPSSFYIAFMFTSTATTGSIWFLDNVLLTTHNITLNEQEVMDSEVKISVLGKSTPDRIEIGIANSEGDYQLALTDMAGRVVYNKQINIQGSNSKYIISGLNLSSGMYFLKMGNRLTFKVAKVVVQ